MRLKIQWPLVLFTLISGFGAAMYLFVSLPIVLGLDQPEHSLEITVASMGFVVAGGFCSVFHVARLQNSLHVLKNLFTLSGITLEILLLGAFLVVELACVVFQSAVDAPGLLRAASALGVVLALLLMFFCGHGYVMPGRPEWDTNLLPVAYLATSLAAGGFACALVRLCLGEPVDGMPVDGVAVLAAALICAVSCLLYGLRVRTAVFSAEEVGVAMEADIERKEDEKSIARSKTIFAGGLIACGFPLTLACGVCAVVLSAPEALMAACALGLVFALAAGVSVRTLMWEVGRCYLPLFDMSEVGITV